jgi:hypothetical protein
MGKQTEIHRPVASGGGHKISEIFLQRERFTEFRILSTDERAVKLQLALIADLVASSLMGIAWRRVVACGFVIALASLIYSTLIAKDPIVSQQHNVVSQFRSRFTSSANPNAVIASTATAQPAKPTSCPSGCIYLNQHNSNASTCVIQCTFPIALSLVPANRIKHHLLPSSLTTFQV